MEVNLNFVLKLSLEEMALRKVVVNLWNENDILAMIQNFETNDFRYENESRIRESTEWRENVEEKVIDKASNLILPKSLKKRMLPIVRLIGYQILSWKIIHEKFEACLLEKLSWLSSGVIDYKTTAKNILRLEKLDVKIRYWLACLYCLEDHIRVIWEKLPEENKRNFYDQLESLFCYRKLPLDIYWAFVLKGEESALDDTHLKIQKNVTSFNQYAFLSSACGGNKAATDYFYQKLNIEEKNSSLLRAASLIIRNGPPPEIFLLKFSTEDLSDVLFHLINKMPLKEKIKILQTQPGGVLRCLLDWPWQDILLDTADFIWTLLPESECCNLMYTICERFRNTAYNFPKLFQDFFLHSPIYFRKEFICSLDHFNFSCDAITDAILSIIRDADVEDKAELVSSFGFIKHLMALIAKDDWPTVESYLREAKLSSDYREIVKDAFEEFLEDYEHYSLPDDFQDALYRASIAERFRLLYDITMDS